MAVLCRVAMMAGTARQLLLPNSCQLENKNVLPMLIRVLIAGSQATIFASVDKQESNL
jgi:hypothetical protein